MLEIKIYRRADHSYIVMEITSRESPPGLYVPKGHWNKRRGEGRLYIRENGILHITFGRAQFYKCADFFHGSIKNKVRLVERLMF